jgi:hypothetical protein
LENSPLTAKDTEKNTYMVSSMSAATDEMSEMTANLQRKI